MGDAEVLGCRGTEAVTRLGYAKQLDTGLCAAEGETRTHRKVWTEPMLGAEMVLR